MVITKQDFSAWDPPWTVCGSKSCHTKPNTEWLQRRSAPLRSTCPPRTPSIGLISADTSIVPSTSFTDGCTAHTGSQLVLPDLRSLVTTPCSTILAKRSYTRAATPRHWSQNCRIQPRDGECRPTCRPLSLGERRTAVLLRAWGSYLFHSTIFCI